MSKFEPPSSLAAIARQFEKRNGVPCDPIRLPELEALSLPPVLPDEAPPDRVPDHPLRMMLQMMYFGPDGEPFDGSLMEVIDRWQAARCQQDSQWLSPSFYRAGTRLQVSTVYLGLDLSCAGPPLIWESMVFHGGARRGERRSGALQWRYSTRGAARAGHVAIVTAIRDAQRARRAAWRRPKETKGTDAVMMTKHDVDRPVTQPRCVYCKQPHVGNVLAVSLGNGGCATCKRVPPVFTSLTAYREALRQPADEAGFA